MPASAKVKAGSEPVVKDAPWGSGYTSHIEIVDDRPYDGMTTIYAWGEGDLEARKFTVSTRALLQGIGKYDRSRADKSAGRKPE